MGVLGPRREGRQPPAMKGLHHALVQAGEAGTDMLGG